MNALDPDGPVAITDFGGLDEAPPVPQLLPFQQRVVEELAELEAKIDRLRVFIGSAAYPALPWQERNRMCRQLAAMTNYAGVLRERIDHFSPPAPTWLADRGDLQARPPMQQQRADAVASVRELHIERSPHHIGDLMP